MRMHNLPFSRVLLLSAPLMVLYLAGCGGADVAPVSGKVTLDGKPLEGAKVVFQPVDQKRPSSGVTNAEGKYDLKFSKDQNGAQIGEHIVRITTAGSKEGPNGEISVPEKLPPKYNQTSTLKKKVESGSNNNVDFDLKSEGFTPGQPAPIPTCQ